MDDELAFFEIQADHDYSGSVEMILSIYCPHDGIIHEHSCVMKMGDILAAIEKHLKEEHGKRIETEES